MSYIHCEGGSACVATKMPQGPGPRFLAWTNNAPSEQSQVKRHALEAARGTCKLIKQHNLCAGLTNVSVQALQKYCAHALL